MSVLLALLAAAAPDHRIVFTRYETREPTAAQMESFENGDKALLTRLMPVTDRAELRLGDGETESFASGKLEGQASLEIDGSDYLLRFDTGSYAARSPMLLRVCRPHVFSIVRTKAGGRTKIVAQGVVVGDGC